MPSRSRSARAHARLQLETPLPGDTNLLELQEQAAAYIYEAKRRDHREPNELVFSVVDAVARFYFGHVIQKQQRRADKSDLTNSEAYSSNR
jgi:hypothetical protein